MRLAGAGQAVAPRTGSDRRGGARSRLAGARRGISTEAEVRAAARPHAADPRRRRARPAQPAGRRRRCGPAGSRSGPCSSRSCATCRPTPGRPPATTRRGSRESWRVMPGGIEIRIELEPGVTFHDGQPADHLRRPVHARRDPRSARQGHRSPAADARRRRRGRADHLARDPARPQAAERLRAARARRDPDPADARLRRQPARRRRARRHRAVEATSRTRAASST